MADLTQLVFGDHRDPSEQLQELFGVTDSTAKVAPNSVGPAIAWGKAIIDAAGVTADRQLLTIRTLRDAEPRLDLRPAAHLAKLLLIT
jgi:hypothetical protein